MTPATIPAAAASAGPRWLRWLLSAAVALIVVPSLLLAMSGLMLTMVMTSISGPAGMLPTVQMVVAVVAIAGTGRAAAACLAQGAARLATLPSWVFGAMHAGAAMVALGLLALAIGRVFPLGHLGDHMAANVLGVPLLLLYVLLVALRRRHRSAGVANGTKRTELVGVGIVIALAVVSVLVLGPRPFDRDLWRAQSDANQDRRYDRYRMALWLRGTDALDGASRDHVVALLGEPSGSGWFRPSALDYPLGGKLSFFPVADHWLVVELDAEGRVARVDVQSVD